MNVPYHKKSWYQIGKEAKAAYGWTHKVLSDLQDTGIIKGSKVIEPRELFYLWVERPTRTVYRDYHVQNPKKILHESPFHYSATTYYAENLIGNYLFLRRFDIYIDIKDDLNWHSYLQDHGVTGKGNFRVLLTDDHIFWKNKKIKNINVVSIQQLILDLLREGAECEEAADHLIRRFYRD